MRTVGITDTTLRDGHQSLLATRMKTEDMLPILDKMDRVGYHSMEVWGGATFDTCMRFLNEDPWERLKQIRAKLKKTKIQMLLRGQNLVGYRHYTDDVVEAFIQKVASYGMDVIRIFDALNDPNNLMKAMEVSKKEKMHVQATISYTISPVHNIDYFIGFARQMSGMGADSICIKDMAGICKPYDGARLVDGIIKATGLPVQMHTHYTSGMGAMLYMKCIEAGASVIDTAASALALSTSQPSTETMVATLQGTEYDTGLDLNALAEINEYFTEVRTHYKDVDVSPAQVDVNVLKYQIPGGMLSNFLNQLKQANAIHRLEEVLAEVPKVREDFGYPPLVTPTSQIVGQQAVVNVLAGRYKMVSSESKNYIRGQYGKTPGPVNQALQDQVLKGEKPLTGRTVDGLEPMMPEIRREAGSLAKSEEDILSYAMFPPVAKEFLTKRG
ncbi:MAG: pyruvate carboxylase subunit B [Peptococcaceae bacterium]|nr:pyruvate carboxylase subunit B [Peptococcaceae bacterium]